MPALNYKAQFAPLVEREEKLTTIRAMRKIPIKPDDTLLGRHYVPFHGQLIKWPQILPF